MRRKWRKKRERRRSEKRGISRYDCMRNVIGLAGTDSLLKFPSPELLLLS